MTTNHIDLPFDIRPRAAELAEVDLGHEGRNKRARTMFEALGSAPESSIPQAMKRSADLEGAYRFFNNPKVDSDAVVAPHINSSWDRAVAVSNAGLWVLAIEDTTEMRFGGNKQRHGLGALMNKGDGFYAHTGLLACLAQTPDGDNIGVPLGLGASEILVRSKDRPKKPKDMGEAEWKKQRRFADDNEFLRWGRVSSDLDAAAAERNVSVVHVADREADDFTWMEEIIDRGGRFVVRQSQERRLPEVEGDDAVAITRLRDLLSADHPPRVTRKICFETVITSGGRRRRKQARKGRDTIVGIHALSTTVLQPKMSRATVESLDVNVVIVREMEPPEGQEPIEWRLLTTEPIETIADILRVVDAYRARWLIEEYFKAIKTGCNYEKLQLETLHGLKIALSFCFAIAWHMLLLRTLARDAPNVRAEAVMTKAQFAVLITIAATPNNAWSVKLNDAPNVTDILYAVARMGGHIKANGTPGWQTLARGFRELEQVVRAKELFAPRSDQS